MFCRPLNKKSILLPHWIKTAESFNFKRIENYYLDLRQTYLALKTETCQEWWLRNLQNQRSKKGAQRGSKSRRGRDGGRGSSSSRYSCKQHIALNFFPMLKSTSTISKFTNLMDCMRTNLAFSNNFKGAISEYKGVWHCQGYQDEVFFDEIMEAPLSEPFFTRRLKMLSKPDGFMLYGKLGLSPFVFAIVVFLGSRRTLLLWV